MHTYRLEFTAPKLDETALRELLEAQYQARGLTITRDVIAASSIKYVEQFKGIDEEIMRLLSDQQPWRQGKLIEVTGKPRVNIARRLGSLLQRGAIQKVMHGVYIVKGAPPPDPAAIIPKETSHANRQREVLDRLSVPKSAINLRDEMRISRQAIEQMLSKMERRGSIKRVRTPRERGAYLYMRAEVDVREALKGRTPDVRYGTVKAKVLSSLLPGRICNQDDIATVAITSKSAIGQYLAKLESEGLVHTFPIGKRKYATILPKGLESPLYINQSAKADAAHVTEEFGARRIPFIQTLYIMGESRTIDITDALTDRELGDQSLSGQIMRQLVQSEMAEQASAEQERHPTYQLTAKGRFVAEMLNGDKSPPSRSEIVARIEERRLKRTAALKERVRSSPAARGSAQSGLMEMLKSTGPMTSAELFINSTPRFNNAGSVTNALKELFRRGDVNYDIKTIDGRDVRVWKRVIK